MNKREWLHLAAGLAAMAAVVLASLLVGAYGDARVSRFDLYLDHQPAPGDCDYGQEQIIVYRSSFGPEDGYSRGWQWGGLRPTWRVSEYGYDQYGWMAMGVQVSDQHLFSPPLRLPRNASRIRLRFYSRENIEPSKANCYDGAMLELSTDGGLSWDQVTGDKLTNAPYDGIILPYTENPLAGRLAWCSKRFSWEESIVNLDEYAGETVALRFRFGTDSSSTSYWYVDHVQVLACQVPGAHRLYLPVMRK